MPLSHSARARNSKRVKEMSTSITKEILLPNYPIKHMTHLLRPPLSLSLSLPLSLSLILPLSLPLSLSPTYPPSLSPFQVQVSLWNPFHSIHSRLFTFLQLLPKENKIWVNIQLQNEFFIQLLPPWIKFSFFFLSKIKMFLTKWRFFEKKSEKRRGSIFKSRDRHLDGDEQPKNQLGKSSTFLWAEKAQVHYLMVTY